MTNKVLIFDSGVGGLSVLQEIHQQQPQLNLCYLMDNAAFPYGTKSDHFLTHRIIDVCIHAVTELQPDLLVIACNTASTLALPLLRQQLTIPVVGVVPAIKTAAALSQSHCFGLLATPATITRPYTDNLIKEFAPHCQVKKMGSAELVYWAENYINQGELPNHKQLYNHLQPWFDNNKTMSHVVLGCTHFPLLNLPLKQLWPSIQWVDSGNAIALRVASLLANTPPLKSTSHQGLLNLFWTDKNATPLGVVSYLSQLGTLHTQSFLHIKPQLPHKDFV